ncbi:MAG: acriflavin resistance protein [Planctomycetaceae bacterium]|nr:acriflavin resistance protein [Planctomycetaceae bacterium]
MTKPLPELEDQRGVLAWFAGNHVASNLLMIFVLAAGLLSMLSIQLEIFPETSIDMITVRVPYLGASPAEVEDGVCMRIEEALTGVDGVKRLRSVAAEGIGTVTVEVEEYADVQEVLDDVKAEVDRIETFPAETEKPVISELNTRTQVMTMVLYGETSERTLKELAEQVEETLKDGSAADDPEDGERVGLFEVLSPVNMRRAMNPGVEDITTTDVSGVRDYEIAIEISEQKLREYGLTFEAVAGAVRRASLDLPGGSIETGGGELLIRTEGQRYLGREFEDIVVVTRADGTRVVLGEIATILDGFDDTDIASYMDGQRSVMINVFRVGRQGALDVAHVVKQYVKQYNALEPSGTNATVWMDRSAYLFGRMSLLTRNAAIGLALVLLALTLFLDMRLAFWTTMGIPISFLGSFVLLPLLGQSLNMISLFAFIVVLGIVVDDAIVVGENVFEYMQRGMSPLRAAIAGVREMAVPVSFAIATTTAAFAPLLFVDGMMGKIMRVIPVVVISVLAISLLEALVILPAHLARAGRSRKTDGHIARLQQRVRDGLQWFIDHPYSRALDWALERRYLTLAIAVAVMLVTVGFVKGGHIKQVMFEPVEADNVWAELSMPQGTSIEQTRAIIDRIERAAQETAAEFDAMGVNPGPIMHHMSTTVGELWFGRLMGGPMGGSTTSSGSHVGEVNLELLAGERRKTTASAFAARWDELVGDVPGVSSLTYNSKFLQTGNAIDVALSHRDFDTLVAASEALKEKLNDFVGVKEIADSFEPGKLELKLELTAEGRMLGLTLEDVARQVRQAFYGEEAQRVQRGQNDIRVMVRYPEAQRRSVADIEQLRIRRPDGVEVPFGTVATMRKERGYAIIQRTDRRRVVNVSGDVNTQVANAEEINEELENRVLPELQQQFAGLTFSFEGERKEQADSMSSLGRNLAVALLAIFGLLGVQFRSYIQPIIIMSVIPFGVVGAVIGHVVMGYDLSMLSMFGLVALTGVVVNDSLIMIDLVNRERRAGRPLIAALRLSGTRRFRPILLTTLTTFLGLMPMILERSLQAKFLIPMAISLGFGVLFATAITLLLVPTFYLVLEDVRGLFIRRSVMDGEMAPAEG